MVPAVLALACGVFCAAAGCASPRGSQVSASSHDHAAVDHSGVANHVAQPQFDEPEAPTSVSTLVTDDGDRWLRVQSVRDGAEGGWATGSFDRRRNRIRIRTHGVRGFSIEVDQIPIAWDRLVVISIDGISSELRKRDVGVYHFIRDKHGRWNVAEP